MSLKNIILTLALSTCALTLSAQIKRIAILETIDKENSVSYAVEVMVRSNLTKVISSAPGYEGYDRVNISQIMDEHDFERTGMVSEEQIRQLGVLSGADYLLVSEAVKFDEANIFVTATLLNVETAKTEKTENDVMGISAQDIQHGCESLASRLLGIQDPYSQERFNTSVAPTTSVTQPATPKPDNIVNVATPVVETPVLVNNKSGRIGEVVNFPDGSQGVVFYLDEDGRGLAISLNEGEEKWDKHRRPDDIGALSNIEIGENNFVYSEGLRNTQAIINVLGDEARAAFWCVLQGEGWYLPSCGELVVLMEVAKLGSPLANTLKSLNSNEISGWYWSSTEKEYDEAWNVSSTGSTATEEKKENVKVRAVRAFTIQ